MNGIKVNQPAVAQPVVTLSKGAEAARAKVIEAGNNLPVSAAQEEGQATTAGKDLQQAVAQMNQFVQSERRDLYFSVDEATGSTVIRVTDSESGDVIRQIPNDLFLRLAAEADEMRMGKLINTQG